MTKFKLAKSALSHLVLLVFYSTLLTSTASYANSLCGDLFKASRGNAQNQPSELSTKSLNKILNINSPHYEFFSTDVKAKLKNEGFKPVKSQLSDHGNNNYSPTYEYTDSYSIFRYLERGDELAIRVGSFSRGHDREYIILKVINVINGDQDQVRFSIKGSNKYFLSTGRVFEGIFSTLDYNRILLKKSYTKFEAPVISQKSSVTDPLRDEDKMSRITSPSLSEGFNQVPLVQSNGESNYTNFFNEISPGGQIRFLEVPSSKLHSYLVIKKENDTVLLQDLISGVKAVSRIKDFEYLAGRSGNILYYKATTLHDTLPQSLVKHIDAITDLAYKVSRDPTFFTPVFRADTKTLFKALVPGDKVFSFDTSRGLIEYTLLKTRDRSFTFQNSVDSSLTVIDSFKGFESNINLSLFAFQIKNPERVAGRTFNPKIFSERIKLLHQGFRNLKPEATGEGFSSLDRLRLGDTLA